jgi:hypothetical protein
MSTDDPSLSIRTVAHSRHPPTPSWVTHDWMPETMSLATP